EPAESAQSTFLSRKQTNGNYDSQRKKKRLIKKLLDEVSKPHILYRKCIYLSPRPNLESIHRKILKEEFRVLKHPPPRPSIQCITYANYLSYFWANNNNTQETLGIKKGSVNEWVRCHNNDLPYTEDTTTSIIIVMLH
uniref:Uncharacterized protein n=1 Tax=Oryza glaberrima TaxID=4538 RepID=I1QZQ0_ORYGL